MIRSSLSIDLLLRRLIIPYLREPDKKVAQTATWIGTPLKVVDSFLFFGVGFRVFRDRYRRQCQTILGSNSKPGSDLGAFGKRFRTISIDFEVRELAWVTFGR